MTITRQIIAPDKPLIQWKYHGSSIDFKGEFPFSDYVILSVAKDLLQISRRFFALLRMTSF